MPGVSVHIDSSQFPDSVRLDLLESLRTRQINHKFHYDSIKQTQKWLELHAAYSPSRVDPKCQEVYDQSFAAAAQRVHGPAVHLIGLGCGGGQKDTRLLKRLKEQGKHPLYTPSDVSVAMVLVAQSAARDVAHVCQPVVCDLATAGDLQAVIAAQVPSTYPRLITFFGMIPNFEPGSILPRLAGLLKQEDWLLFSANLAPGSDYGVGVQRILPLYDNNLTREWLMIFLQDLGVEGADGVLEFAIETTAEGLKRITATFVFSRPRRISVDAATFDFEPGAAIRLFYSYRYTPERITDLLARHHLQVVDQWITPSEEEGVFLCAKV